MHTALRRTAVAGAAANLDATDLRGFLEGCPLALVEVGRHGQHRLLDRLAREAVRVGAPVRAEESSRGTGRLLLSLVVTSTCGMPSLARVTRNFQRASSS